MVIMLALLVGAADEVHQSLLPGRVAGWDDWLADVVGTGLGLIRFKRAGFRIWDLGVKGRIEDSKAGLRTEAKSRTEESRFKGQERRFAPSRYKERKAGFGSEGQDSG